MLERFSVPPDAKARLAMRDRRDAAHDHGSRRSPSAEGSLVGDLVGGGDDREMESDSASVL